MYLPFIHRIVDWRSAFGSTACSNECEGPLCGAGVMTLDDYRIREVRKADLPAIRAMILPQFHPMRRKLLWMIATHWAVQVILQ